MAEFTRDLTSKLLMQQLKNYINNLIFIDENDLNRFCNLFEYQKIPRKELLLKQGDICKFEAFVTKGCFRLFYLDSIGKEHTLYFAIKNWWATDIDSYLHNIPAQFPIQTLEDCEILFINKPDKVMA